ncbi:hypothetical protein [Deinococcus yavapaiensis]|uniref:Lipoprotein n=1 Tax=Deinococcus yavapaiensis KR-236 TaxID=694435 RepID=A0A318SBI9_9DEIO|nr:hypothetical protein [Deinococcus yavapaiensis]PYE53659.1 hypothetical protein DES52_108190 [Deinococcus yavapaiensis KR-236]
MKKRLALPAFTLAVTACSNAPTPPVTGNGHLGDAPLTLTGRIVNYDPTSGNTLKAYYESALVAQTNVAGTGDFSVTLPKPTATQLFDSQAFSSCGTNPTLSRNITASAPAPQVQTPSLTVGTDFHSLARTTASTDTSPVTLVVYTYADQPGSINGTVVCQVSSGTRTMNWNATFEKGWNTLIVRSSSTLGNVTYNYTVEGIPNGPTWTTL